MSTQWHRVVGMVGAFYEGLRYESFREIRLGLGIRIKDWPEIFRGVQVMEMAAKEVLNDRKER